MFYWLAMLGTARAAVAGLAVAATIAGSASGATPTVTEFSTGITSGATPREITAGPDGNL